MSVKHSEGPRLKAIAHHFQIYPGTKTTHFRAIAKASGIAYHDMVFFDNERRNCVDVATLGVHPVYTPDGLTVKDFRRGLREWQAKRRESGGI